MKLPLDQFRLSADQINTRNQAWERLEQACMSRFGLEGIVGSRRLPPRQSPLSVFLDIEQAKHSGYDALQINNTDSGHLRRTTPATLEQQQAATGVFTGTTQTYNGQPVPAGGCEGEARAAIMPKNATPVREDASDLAFKAGGLASRDSRVVKATQEWVACMKAAGFNYTGPNQARNDPRWAAPSSAEENTIATTDAQCRARTNLLNIQVAVEVAYQNQLINQHKDELAISKKQLSAMVNNAQGS
ncbi:hypothetical protein ACQPYK_04265 [Streptosporangium sp. CA-135522]|uniref:hypothetical protein n=1 Tax=Streptosporangium sp. CA-135522 TaxID=3240072 RepID=UPI003D8A303F